MLKNASMMTAMLVVSYLFITSYKSGPGMLFQSAISSVSDVTASIARN